MSPFLYHRFHQRFFVVHILFQCRSSPFLAQLYLLFCFFVTFNLLSFLVAFSSSPFPCLNFFVAVPRREFLSPFPLFHLFIAFLIVFSLFLNLFHHFLSMLPRPHLFPTAYLSPFFHRHVFVTTALLCRSFGLGAHYHDHFLIVSSSLSIHCCLSQALQSEAGVPIVIMCFQSTGWVCFQLITVLNFGGLAITHKSCFCTTGSPPLSLSCSILVASSKHGFTESRGPIFFQLRWISRFNCTFCFIYMNTLPPQDWKGDFTRRYFETDPLFWFKDDSQALSCILLNQFIMLQNLQSIFQKHFVWLGNRSFNTFN